MFGVILLVAVAFVAVVVMGINLSSKSDEIQKLKTELANPKKDSGCEPFDRDAMYRAIQEEGYFPTKDADGDITFKIKGTKIFVGECAEGFVYTRVYYGLQKEDVISALFAANQVEKTYVAIKSIVSEEDGSLIFSVESYCMGVEMYRSLFQRSLSIIADSIDAFWEEMRKCNERHNSQVALTEEQNKRLGETKMLS